ncbi:MAG: glycosyltransferase family 2 protein [Caulobacteraceae bacterium]
MHVAVAIVGFRNATDVARCLAALALSSHADFEVTICENGGPAAHAALLAAIPAALTGGQPVRAVLAPGNLGFAGGVNFCLAEAPGAGAWWVLNPDTIPEPEALAACVARLERGDCEAVGCTLYRPDGSVQSHGGAWSGWLGRAVSIGIGGPLDAAVDAAWIERRQNYLNGAAMLVGRRFVEVVGPMREDYFLYCEEVEWCLRGLARGMRLGYAPGGRVLHEQGTTTGAIQPVRTRPRAPTYLGERNGLLLTRDRYPARLPVTAAATLAQIVLRSLRGRSWRLLRFGLAGWWAGLRGERGVPEWIGA